MLHPVPYWRLSSFYFFYFALLGTLLPYLPLYLQSLDYSVQEIGYIAAVMMVTRVVAPNFWGWLCARTGRRLTIIRWGSLLALLCFGLQFYSVQFFWMALVIACFSFFWNAILSQFEVVTLDHLGGQSHHYSRIRVWGSIGFIVVVGGLGMLFDRVAITAFPWIVTAILVLIGLSTLSIREPDAALNNRPALPFVNRVLSRPVMSFLICSFLLQLSHGSYYTFYSVLLESLQYSRAEIGFLWALGVIAEVVLFMVMHKILHRYSVRTIMLVSLLLTVIRWWLIGCYAEMMSIVVGAQLLHAFSFGVTHAVSIELVRRFFQGSQQGQGQALLSAVGFGAGGASGALLSGWLWGISSVLSFAISALAAALALMVAWWGLRGKLVER